MVYRNQVGIHMSVTISQDDRRLRKYCEYMFYPLARMYCCCNFSSTQCIEIHKSNSSRVCLRAHFLHYRLIFSDEVRDKAFFQFFFFHNKPDLPFDKLFQAGKNNLKVKVFKN